MFNIATWFEDISMTLFKTFIFFWQKKKYIVFSRKWQIWTFLPMTRNINNFSYLSFWQKTPPLIKDYYGDFSVYILQESVALENRRPQTKNWMPGALSEFGLNSQKALIECYLDIDQPFYTFFMNPYSVLSVSRQTIRQRIVMLRRCDDVVLVLKCFLFMLTSYICKVPIINNNWMWKDFMHSVNYFIELKISFAAQMTKIILYSG